MKDQTIAATVRGWFAKDKLKQVPRMLLAVIVMGICVELLKLSSFGPDPSSAMNYGLSAMMGLSLGTWQLILNTLVFIIVFIIDRSLLGLGSFGNMILVGYSADLTAWVLERFFGVTELVNMSSRIAYMVPSLIVFIFAAAVYMNCGLGTAPYDAVSFLIHRHFFEMKGRKVSFRLVRIIYDAVVTVIAYLVHGEVGLVTVLMVFTLGPAVDLVGKWIGRSANKSERTNS